MSVIDDWGSPCEIALTWMSLNLTNDKSKLGEVMAWCRQETSHYIIRANVDPFPSGHAYTLS